MRLGYPLRMLMVTRTAGAALVLIALWVVSPVATQQRSAYDYWRVQRQIIERGQQAIFMCNGLFTSNRTIEQIFAQELKFLKEPVGSPTGGITSSTARGAPWQSGRTMEFR